MNIKTILAIETSCDESAVSIVSAKQCANILSAIKVCAHIVQSQIQIHRPFGGVVPEIASRDHLSKISTIVRDALTMAKCNIKDIDAVAVTLGPGLIGALMVGVLFARGLAFASNKLLIGVNHVDAHLAPTMLLQQFSPIQDINVWQEVELPQFPAIALTVSGGHCNLSYFTNPLDKIILGKTLDDACGEAFDKVAKLLGLAYPGGQIIEAYAARAADRASENLYKFPNKIADKNNKYDFSYSGLKTAVMEAVKKKLVLLPKEKISGANLALIIKEDIAYAFQEAAFFQLKDRLSNALQAYPQTKSILIAGGVAQNQRLRELLQCFGCPVYFAPPALCGDNATMIALHAFLENRYDAFTAHPFARYQ